jgi:hypothetical protein
MEDRVRRIESMVEMAAPRIPTITKRAKILGMKGWERSVGVALSAPIRPGLNTLVERPHITETKV